MSDETELLIQQAAREIGINRNGDNPIRIEAGEMVAATFFDHGGAPARIEIKPGTSFMAIHDALRNAWRKRDI